ncbi:MAG: cytochrome c, class [Bacteroidetes bacterium]|nr:cytochrome c, class [Bacteroidota bacterium]
MKKILKWVGIVLGVLVVVAFLAFLYFIPPFTLVPPEEFSNPIATAGPSLDNITDPVERALAERGKYIVRVYDCGGCHTPVGDQGPNWDEFLAGGFRTVFQSYGTFTSRNLTPDKETGLARRTDEEVKRVLRTGLLPEGRVAHYRDMPWGAYSRRPSRRACVSPASEVCVPQNPGRCNKYGRG